MLDRKLSTFIEQQFPTIYREEGPFFVEFLKQYFVWLETDTTSPVYHSRKYLSDHDIDTTVDGFIVYFKEKYLKNIQLNTATNTKQLIKNSIDLYRSKGTENAISLFFDLIFSAEAEVYYPGNDVFRLSDADFAIPEYIEITSKPINRLLVGRSVTGVESRATAFVERLVRRRVKNNFIEVLYISAVTGQFQTGEIIRLTTPGNTAMSEFPAMLGSLTSLDVEDGGDGFAKGEVVNLTSRTGAQGKAIVEEIKSINGTVDFDLVHGGWGYTSNSEVRVSESVLFLKTASILSSTNSSLYGKIQNLYQPLANVQWYDNTAPFGTGDIVYNYYANGDLIGRSKIISAEYGLTNTTNYFLLSTISGDTDIDYTAATYYTEGNTASFEVQMAGHVDLTATANAIGMSSNVFIYGVGNNQSYQIGDTVYQLSTNNQIIVEAVVSDITVGVSNSYTMKVTDIQGLFLNNQILLKKSSDVTSSITHLSYEIGVRNVNNSFVSLPGNIIKDDYPESQFRAVVDRISFGSGANVSFDDDLVNTETVLLNTNYLIDHIDDDLERNWINATSYGASLNNASLMTPVLSEALQFDVADIGTIARLELENPGEGYSYPPFVEVYDPLVGPLNRMDFVIRINDSTGVFKVGERVTQAINGAKGVVKFANTTEVHIERQTYEQRWEIGVTNNHIIVGESTGFGAYATEITRDIDGIIGRNAVISTTVDSSNSAASKLKVIDSGFAFLHGDQVIFSSLDVSRSGSAWGDVTTHGIASGYYRTTSGFLSNNKYLYDGDYYQDFSYEIRSPITVSRYSDMLKNVLHVSGTKAFSAILDTQIVNCVCTVASTTVEVTSI